jgi:CheY-specific phosphatase CheX
VEARDVEFKTTDISEIVTDIWTAMLGFSVQLRTEPAAGEPPGLISARVTITGEWDGFLVVNCPEQLSREVATAMLQVEEEQLTLGTVFDAVGEVANMTAGNVKNLIEGLCRLTTPTVTDEADLSVPDEDSEKVFEAAFDCRDQAFSVTILQAA